MTAIFVDGLGRVLQTKKDAAIFQKDGAPDKEQMIVSGRVFFDALGRTTKAYYPVIDDSGEANRFIGDHDKPVPPTTTTYDVLNRALRVTLPDQSITETEYGFGTDREGKLQFSTKTTDANGIATTQFTDVKGRVTAVKNAGNTWTSFAYNAMSEQVKATDPMGNSTISKYDWFGRRISRVHPDAGETIYKYDLAGNLTELITANLSKTGGAIQYMYDHERLIDILYPNNPENDVHYEYGPDGDSENRAGRITTQVDASGSQDFYYGPLGEVVKNVRTIVIPRFEDQTYTTEWKYDTWNRLTEMTYPDGEKVEYTYNVGGLLHSMRGKKKGTTYEYVTQLGYDKFEQRVFLAYGNGTKTTYDYEPERRRLKNMVASTASGRAMMDNVYEYDAVNNILSLKNNAPVPTANLMGGSSEYSYEYDELYRLTDAVGNFKGANHEHQYTLKMAYNPVGGITQKTQTHQRKGVDSNDWTEQHKTTYDMAYAYGNEQPNAPKHIGDKAYSYDANGNQTGWTHDVSGQRRQVMWDEENRIRAIYDNGAVHHYTYDASGTRVLKGKSNGQAAYVNGEWTGGSGGMGNYTVYVNPYLVLKSGSYTKHFYIEGQRIVSKLGDGLGDATNGTKAGNGTVSYGAKQEEAREAIVKNLKFLGQDGSILTAGNSGKTPPGQINGKGKGGGKDGEQFQYFYHPDHLGSTSYITDASGEVYQHLEYFAFGETFVEEHSNTNRTPYLFNGKELDEETGLYYYGARYYEPQISVWLSVDPLSEDFPNASPYNYVLNNPIKSIDPDGRSTYTDADGNVVGGTVDDKDKGVYMVDGLTKDAFDIGKIDEYKKQGKLIGRTLSLNSFVAPEDGKWRGKVNFTNEAENSLSKVTSDFGNYMSDHTLNESLSHYMSEGGNGGDYDIKSWGVDWNELSSEQKLNHVYQASFASPGIIMTKRDQGNFFAGRAAKMMGLPLSTTLSGFGAFQSNRNKTGFMFYIKAALNQVDQMIMGAAINGTPMDGMKIRPVFPDHRGSEDLQRAGYNQYSR